MCIYIVYIYTSTYVYTHNAGSGVDESEVMCESQDCQTFSLLLTSVEPEACFQVSVADDSDVETLQSFEISLTTAQPRVAIGNTVTVDVTDNDGIDIETVHAVWLPWQQGIVYCNFIVVLLSNENHPSCTNV